MGPLSFTTALWLSQVGIAWTSGEEGWSQPQIGLVSSGPISTPFADEAAGRSIVWDLADRSARP